MHQLNKDMLTNIAMELSIIDVEYFEELERAKLLLVLDESDYGLINDTIDKRDVIGFLMDDSLGEGDEIVNPWNEATCLVISRVDKIDGICYVNIWE